MYRITVVIPTYNGARYIGEALESVRRQTLGPVDVVVVDDCSNDKTVAAVRSFAAQATADVRVIQLSRNSGGPARPINEGVAATRGDLVLVLDQDDVLLPDALERLAGALADEPDLVCAASMCGNLEDATPIPWASAVFEPLCKTGQDRGAHSRVAADEMLAALIERGNFLIGWPCLLFRRDVWTEKKGGADESLRIASDFDFLCWLATRGDFGLLPSVGYLRREHDSNVCRNRLGVAAELLRVRWRYARMNRQLLAKQRADIAEIGSGVSYKLRQVGQYRESLRCLEIVRRAKPFKVRPFVDAAKLIAHWMLKRRPRHETVA